jgi:hypothetical protein
MPADPSVQLAQSKTLNLEMVTRGTRTTQRAPASHPDQNRSHHNQGIRAMAATAMAHNRGTLAERGILNLAILELRSFGKSESVLVAAGFIVVSADVAAYGSLELT